jgi:signal transduction histidine kinase
VIIMDQQPNDRFGIGRARKWYAVVWVLFGLCPPLLAVQDDPGTRKYWTLALLAVLGLGYAVVGLFPGNPVLRPYPYLMVLVAGLGLLAALPGGGAALYIVALPQFWMFGKGPRDAITSSGAAAAATILGSTLDQGWSPDFRTGNVIAALVGYAASVLIGLWLYRFIEQSEERYRRVSTELASAQQQLVEAHRAQGAAEERARFAREIHDTLAQGFASIVVLAEAARTGLDRDPARSAQQLVSIENTARENLAEARVLVGAAPPGGVAHHSVARSLHRVLDRFTEDTGIAVTADLPDIACDQPTRIALLRCTQESLANVRKHAAASAVGVVLVQESYGIELEITDDGRGFTVEDARGFGLDGMRKRLTELGGELLVTSSVGNGTRILAMIPTNGQV